MIADTYEGEHMSKMLNRFHMWFPGGIVMLLGSSILVTIGVYLFSTQTGAMAYVAAVIYACGIAYFWPNMIGFIADKIPKSGAFGMSIIGEVGMFSTSIFQPIIGRWIDSDRAEAAAQGLTGDELELVAGQATLGTTGRVAGHPHCPVHHSAVLGPWDEKDKPRSVLRINTSCGYPETCSLTSFMDGLCAR